MVFDLHREMKIEYTQTTNLPKIIGWRRGTIENHYTFDGQKLGKKVYDYRGNLTLNERYFDELLMQNGKVRRLQHGDGYISLTQDGNPVEYFYYLKDHLGNIRATITQATPDSLLITQANDYYPFGMAYTPKLTGLQASSWNNKFKYNGKEEQEMPGGWLDYGARFYDAGLGRWHGVDPLAEEYPYLTPYNYVGNRPLVFIDPDGKEAMATKYVDPNGRTIIDTDDGRDDVVIVPWRSVVAFTRNAQAAERTGHSNSIGWNDYWRSEFGIAISESFLSQFHSQTTKNAYIDYAFSGNYDDWLWFLLSELGGQWSDPVLALQGLSMGVNGLHFTSILKFSQSVLKNKKNGLQNIGYQLQKHAGRKGSAFGNLKYSHITADKDGLKIINSIAKSSNKKIIKQPSGGYTVYDLNTGRGYSVSRTGKFNGFRELPN